MSCSSNRSNLNDTRDEPKKLVVDQFTSFKLSSKKHARHKDGSWHLVIPAGEV
jgi:hypothetical protein